MFVVDRPKPMIRMHSVHRLFGLVLIGVALSHIQLSSRAISAHLKERSAAIAAAVLAIALVSTYALVALNPILPGIAEPLGTAAQRAENRDAAAR